jgi:hypothetical protein
MSALLTLGIFHQIPEDRHCQHALQVRGLSKPSTLKQMWNTLGVGPMIFHFWLCLLRYGCRLAPQTIVNM